MGDTLIVALLYQIPEGLMIAVGGLGILGIREPRRRILLCGLLYGLCVPVVRALGVPLGLHTLVLMGIFVAITTRLLKIRFLTALTTWMLALSLIILGEHLLVAPLRHAYGLTLDELRMFPLRHVLWGWISAGFLVGATLAVIFGRFVLLPAPEADRAHGGHADST